MMYNPPIKLFEAPVQAIMQERENAIFAQIQANFHVEVDKDELVRALQYDRGQYDQGFKDGAAPKWIPVTERLPEKDTLVLCVGAKGGMFLGYPRTIYGNETTAYTMVPNSRGGRQTKYWMPLPKTPEER